MPDQWLEYLIAENLERKMDKLSLRVGGVHFRVKTIINILLSSVPYSKDINGYNTSQKYAPENLKND